MKRTSSMPASPKNSRPGLAAALALIPEYAVFPVSARSKQPALSNAMLAAVLGQPLRPGQGGHNAASTHPERVRALFEAAPASARVGVNCAASGIVVLDIDTHKDPERLDRWRVEHRALLDAAKRVHSTPSGGWHYVFDAPDGASFSGRLVGPDHKPIPGIDVKHKGYVVWPTPNSGYEVVRTLPAEVPRPDLWPRLPPALLRMMQAAPSASRGEAVANPTSTEDLEAAVLAGEDYHGALLTLSIRDAMDRADRGEALDPEPIVERLRTLVTESAPQDPDRQKRRVQLLQGTEIERMVEGAIAKADPAQTLALPVNEDILAALGGKTFMAPTRASQVTVQPSRPIEELADELEDGQPGRHVPTGALPPPRRWLHGHHLIRGHISVTSAPGGLGKSTAVLAECVDVAIQEGRITGQKIYKRPLHVLYINGEDPLDEIDRRLAALCQEYEIAPSMWGRRLHRVSGRDYDLCLIEESERDVIRRREDAIKLLMQLITEASADIVVLDPLTSFHRLSENSNTSIAELMNLLREIMHQYGVAIHLVHHSVKVANQGALGKTLGASATRGASALMDAARAVRTLRHLTGDENEIVGLDRKDQSVIRVTTGKGNMAIVGTGYSFTLHSVQLDNGDDEHPEGDSVGVLKRFDEDLDRAAMDVLSTHQAVIDWLHTLDPARSYRASPPGGNGRKHKDWVGHDLMAKVPDINTVADALHALARLEELGMLVRFQDKNAPPSRPAHMYRVVR